MSHTYESAEVLARHLPTGAMELRHRTTGATIEMPLRRESEAWAIMLELDGAARLALGLPTCEAVTGGTALCLGRADKVADGTVPLPKAPTCWDELVEAELWPMTWLGKHKGMQVEIHLPNEQ
jgi:hypothetical protein